MATVNTDNNTPELRLRVPVRPVVRLRRGSQIVDDHVVLLLMHNGCRLYSTSPAASFWHWLLGIPHIIVIVIVNRWTLHHRERVLQVGRRWGGRLRGCSQTYWNTWDREPAHTHFRVRRRHWRRCGHVGRERLSRCPVRHHDLPVSQLAVLDECVARRRQLFLLALLRQVSAVAHRRHFPQQARHWPSAHVAVAGNHCERQPSVLDADFGAPRMLGILVCVFERLGDRACAEKEHAARGARARVASGRGVQGGALRRWILATVGSSRCMSSRSCCETFGS